MHTQYEGTKEGLEAALRWLRLRWGRGHETGWRQTLGKLWVIDA